MLNTRKDLIKLAAEYYVPLLEKAAHRYENNEQYVIADTVGYNVTMLEELFRPLWGIAPILNEESFEINVNGVKYPINEYITKVICEGTDESSDKCFDKDVTEESLISFANQCVTEIAAYLVTVIFARDILWDVLSQEKKDKIANWILKWSLCALKDSWPNNHYWYPIFCIEILKQLGYSDSSADDYMKLGYEVLDSLYIGNGWYTDGSFGRFDYYEAWAHHAYTLLWILIVDKSTPGYDLRCSMYRNRTEEFIRFFSHYFDSDGGMVAYGRSLSYRFAAVSVFGLAAAAGCDIDYGAAKNIILKNIEYFFNNSIPTEDGRLPCGYLYSAPGFAESYASEGANCCYTEGFMCLLCDDNHPLWKSDANSLPVEKEDYLIECPAEGLDILVQGENDFGGITLYNNSVHYFQDGFFHHRFNDMAGYYSKFAYNSRAGFAISTRDMLSCDNMISLITPDGRMCSQRTEICTISSEKNLLVSYHIPFSNDSKTKITTYTIPLSGGYHVRAHKIELSQSYIVKEGGFTIGYTDDSIIFDSGRLIYGDYISGIKSAASCALNHTFDKCHPSMHLLRPMAAYPCVVTDVLPEGTYYFASLICFSSTSRLGEEPDIALEGNMLTVKQGEFYKKISL